MPARVKRAVSRGSPVPVIPKNKASSKSKKTVRVPLADRTNSASDENKSKQDAAMKPLKGEECARPRRAQRVPARLADHITALTPPQRKIVLSKNLKEKSTRNKAPIKVHLDLEQESESPFKNPQPPHSASIDSRPRREQRLPARFSDHSISPSKFVPLKLGWASTPLPAQEKVVQGRTRSQKATVTRNVISEKKRNVWSNAKSYVKKPDTNNNPPVKERSLPEKKKDLLEEDEAAEKPSTEVFVPRPCTVARSPKPRVQFATLIESPKSRNDAKIFKTGRIYSPKLQASKKESPKLKEKLSIYEFTFDPNEEPKIPKKKRKKQPVRKKAAPRRVVIKDNYTKNVAKQLESLKDMISKKSSSNNIVISANLPTQEVPPKTIVSSTITNVQDKENQNQPETHDEVDLRDQFDDDPISYSPVPVHKAQTVSDKNISNGVMTNLVHAKTNDPLNLIDDFSFFDEVPVASSSLRKSAAASPWRVDCRMQSKWPVNMYVKPNMTPAYESSFANVDIDMEPKRAENPEHAGLFTDQSDAGGLKQTSILSFIKEVAEKKAHKKAATPTKSVLGIIDSSSDTSHVSLDQLRNLQENSSLYTPEKNLSADQPNAISPEVLGRIDSTPANVLEAPKTVLTTPEKSCNSSKEKKKESNKYFGFDDSEDLENVSPQKKVKYRGGRILRSRPVLKDLNHQKPMRMTTYVKPFAPTSEVVAKVYEEIQSGNRSPVELPAVIDETDSGASDVSLEASKEASVEVAKEKSPPPVGLFQDVEVVHYVKPYRKSYGKARKVTFQQTTTTVASDAEASDGSSGEDDMKETGFTVPTVRQKKTVKRKKKVQKMSKKEAEEASAWMAGFNSMVEEVEEFPLVVE